MFIPLFQLLLSHFSPSWKKKNPRPKTSKSVHYVIYIYIYIYIGLSGNENGNMKQICSLVINNKIINKPDEILAAQRDFYSKLYTCPQSDVYTDSIDTYLNGRSLRQVSEISKENF